LNETAVPQKVPTQISSVSSSRPIAHQPTEMMPVRTPFDPQTRFRPNPTGPTISLNIAPLVPARSTSTQTLIPHRPVLFSPAPLTPLSWWALCDEFRRVVPRPRVEFHTPMENRLSAGSGGSETSSHPETSPESVAVLSHFHRPSLSDLRSQENPPHHIPPRPLPQTAVVSAPDG
jgi:hypothetical protein